jgi:hypothetical protein
MRLPWIFGSRLHGRRRVRKIAQRGQRHGSTLLRVRQLERRRVLDAAAQSLVVGSTLEVGQESTVTSSATTAEPLAFDWSAKDAASESAAAVNAFVASVQNAHSDGQQAFGLVENSLPGITAAVDQEITAGDPLNLSGVSGNDALAFVGDPDENDTHTAAVDWGDGSALESVTIINPQVIDGTLYFGLAGTHQYSVVDTYTVTVYVADNHMSGDFENGEEFVDFMADRFDVTVVPHGDNTPPNIVAAADQEIFEGDTLNLSGVSGNDALAFVGDLDENDTHTAAVDWGDGSALESVTIINPQVIDGTLYFGLAGTHQYSVVDTYTVTVYVADNHMSGDFENGEEFVDFMADRFDVTVVPRGENMPPNIIAAADQEIFEGDTLNLSGVSGNDALAFVGDVDETDTHTAAVDWGDGSGFESVTFINPVVIDGTLFFSLGGSHKYLEGGAPFTNYTVTVRVADDKMSGDFENGEDGVDFVEDTFVVKVLNVTPVVDAGDPSDINENDTFTLVGSFTDRGVLDAHNVVIDWDDPNDLQNSTFAVTAILNASGTPVLQVNDTFLSTDGAELTITAIDADTGLVSFRVEHRYLDDGPAPGNNTPSDQSLISVTVTDDDAASNFDNKSLDVNNVEPDFIEQVGATIDENSTATISVKISDPGTRDVFSVVVNWQDGGVSDTIDFLGLSNIATTTEGVTTYSWNASESLLTLSHHYNDDNPTGTASDPFAVSLVMNDDDTGAGDTSIVVVVRNVAPEELVFTVSDPDLEINESESVSIAGSFTDRLINFSSEQFRAFVLWGDNEYEELSLNLLAAQATFGSITHTYADNNPNNIDQIRVRVADDDMGAFATPAKFLSDEGKGTDYVEYLIDLRVLNVDPVLQPLTATDVEPSGRATVTLSFSDPGADTFQVLVDWGDRLGLPPDQRFTVETLHTGTTPTTYTLEHFYTGPPDPLNPAADIIISVVIHDDDAATLGVVQPGISNVESIAITNPGIDTDTPNINTTPQIPRLDFPSQPVDQALLSQSTSTIQTLQSSDARSTGGRTATSSKRFLELVAYGPDGKEINRYELDEEELADLRKLFARLPDGRYEIYLVRTDTNTRRLVMDVYVRRGRLIDPQDKSEDMRDRPPTSASENNAAALDPTAPAANAADHDAAMLTDGITVDNPRSAEVGGRANGVVIPSPELPAPSYSSLRWGSSLAGLAIVANSPRWSRKVDAALAKADRNAWQRLRRAGRLGRADSPAKRVNAALLLQENQVQ